MMRNDQQGCCCYICIAKQYGQPDPLGPTIRLRCANGGATFADLDKAASRLVEADAAAREGGQVSGWAHDHLRESATGNSHHVTRRGLDTMGSDEEQVIRDERDSWYKAAMTHGQLPGLATATLPPMASALGGDRSMRGPDWGGIGSIGHAIVSSGGPFKIAEQAQQIKPPTVRATADIPANLSFSAAWEALTARGARITRHAWAPKDGGAVLHWVWSSQLGAMHFGPTEQPIHYAPSTDDLWATDWAVLP